MRLPNLKLNRKYVGVAAALVILVAVGIMSGFTAVRVLVGMVVIYFVPSYLILRNFELDEDEKIFLSFFLGFGLFPIVVFFLNRIIPSLLVSVVVTFVVSVAAGVLLGFAKKKKLVSQ
jgi:uncharacterized membrane protein